jgi:hypothetical protein
MESMREALALSEDLAALESQGLISIESRGGITIFRPVEKISKAADITALRLLYELPPQESALYTMIENCNREAREWCEYAVESRGEK